MKCPRCQSASEVIETRATKRRRACLSTTCGHRWSTTEISTTELGQMRADTLRLIRVRNMINEGKP